MAMQKFVLLINLLLPMVISLPYSAAVASSTAIAQIPDSTISIQDRLKQLATLDYHDSDFKARIADGRLATLYVQSEQQLKWVQELQAFTGMTSQIIDARDNLQELSKNIRTFYEDYVKTSWIGEQAAWEHPDIIVILGANRTVLEQRLTYALTLINKFPAVPIVLSGGGRSFELEAAVMRDYLQRHNVTNPLIMETDSLDTVGNAVFTDFALKENHLSGKSILLITSSFHGPRSLFLFQNILPPDYRLAVALAPYDREDLSVRIDSELRQMATSIDTLLHWGMLPGQTQAKPIKNACDVLFQMQSQHKLYLSRWDLARKYNALCYPDMIINESIPSE